MAGHAATASTRAIRATPRARGASGARAAAARAAIGIATGTAGVAIAIAIAIRAAPRHPLRRAAVARHAGELTAGPGEPAARHEPATIAHFEPQPKADAPNKPYVVWSSAPSETSPERGKEE